MSSSLMPLVVQFCRALCLVEMVLNILCQFLLIERDNVYLGGYTNSQNLPVIAGYKNFGGSFGAPFDGFLFKIDSAFKKYLISKYITSSSPSYEYISAITVNDNNEIFIGGLTNGGDLPAKTNNISGAGYNYLY